MSSSSYYYTVDGIDYDKKLLDSVNSYMEERPAEKLSIPSHLKNMKTSSADDDSLRKKREEKKREKTVTFLQSVNTRNDKQDDVLEEIKLNIIDQKEEIESDNQTKKTSKNFIFTCDGNGSLKSLEERNYEKYKIKKIILSKNQEYFIDEKQVFLPYYYVSYQIAPYFGSILSQQ